MNLIPGRSIQTFAIVVALVGSPLHAAPPVEGDRGLLQLLIDAQATNESLYRRGEMEVEVENRFRKSAAKATVVWEGDKTYWDYWYREPLSPDPTTREPRVSEREVQMIEKPEILMTYKSTPNGGFARKINDHRAGTSYPRELKVRPRDLWFSFEGGRSWREMLDPARAHGGIVKYVVERPQPETVVVDILFKRGGRPLRVEASLKHGANVVAYRTLPAPGVDGFWREGRYEWAQDSDGNWYPKRYEYRRSSAGDPDELDRDFVLTIKKLNPRPKILSNRFEFASFKAARRTILQEKGRTSRTYRLSNGKPEVENSQEQLDALTRKLKNDGFAAPKKKAQ